MNAEENQSKVDQNQTSELTRRDTGEVIQKQAEEIIQLRKDQQALLDRVRHLVKNFPLGLIVLDKNQKIEAVNDKTMEYFQYTGEEMKNLHVSLLFPEVKAIEVGAQPVRLMARRKNGETFVVEIAVNMFSMSGGSQLFVSVQDITERSRLEQLRRDLIGMVSHDLRTPLTAVRLTLEMVNEEVFGPISDRGHRSVGQAVSAAGYLTSLVENLLDAEKAESGGIEVDINETTVHQIIEKAISVIPKERGITVETDYTNDSIKVDRDRIVQVLINLITNAIKYSPDNGKVLVLAGMEGVVAKFQVIDQGPGIPKDMQTLVFERYRQLQQAHGTKRKGFGLGLAICKALVEAHKGRIWVESNPEKGGSKFCFTVPISPD